MNNNHVQNLLNGYLDGEIDLVNALEIEDHLKDCPTCAQEYAELLELRRAIKNQRAALFHPAPDGLRRQIRGSLRKTEPRPFAGLRIGAWQAATTVLALAVFALVTGIASGWFQPQQNQLADEVQAAHIRSLMAGHLTDVASTDQHTVKPWFNGKLDFSPPVINLAADGFPLLGGRLEYLDGHPAAGLVYQRGKHVINLFIWPTAAKDQSLSTSSAGGYDRYHWVQSGMEYWAVSDVNPTDLKEFVTLMQKNSPSTG